MNANRLWKPLAGLAMALVLTLTACAPTAPPPTATPTFFPIIPTPEPPTATPTLMPLVILPTATRTAPPPATGYYRVLTGANCREQSNEKARLVLTFNAGTIVQGVDRTFDGTWLQVSVPEVDQRCWISAELLAPSNPPVAPTPLPPAAAGTTPLFQAANVTSCRQGPGILYRIDTVLQPGDTAPVMGVNQTADWVLLLTENDVIRCWVSLRMGTVNTPVESLRVMTMFRLDKQGFCRQGPATFYPPETSYIPPRYFVIQGRTVDDRWLWIERNRTTWHCWLSNSLGVIDGSLEKIPVMTGIQLRENANCRVGPGTLYDVVAQVPADTVLAVEGRSPAGKWLYSVLPDGVQRCWVSADVGRLPGTLDGIPVVAPPAEPSPVITLSQSAQCREGPSVDYPMRTGFDVDRVLLVNGRNADASWLRVQNPTTGPDCWVWASLGVVQGDLQTVPVVTVPPP